MRRTLALLLIIPSALPSARPVRAQSTFVVVDSGARIRVTGCLPDCGTRLTGSVLGVDGGSMILAEEEDTITVSLQDADRVEVGTAYRFNAKKALYWGGGTAAVIALLAAADGSAESGAQVLGAAAVWGFGAAVFAGGGRKALKSGLIGALIAAPAVGLLAAATYEPCTGWCFVGPDSKGGALVWGALAGGAAGFLIGGAIGAFTGGESWTEVGGDRVRVSVTPTADGGVAVAGTVPF